MGKNIGYFSLPKKENKENYHVILFLIDSPWEIDYELMRN